MRLLGTCFILVSLANALSRGFRRAPPIKVQEEMGISPTLSVFSVGFFDPLELANDANFSLLREAELKHGRVCMMATLGMALSNKDVVEALINGDIPPITAEPAIHGLTRTSAIGMLVVCGILETQVLVQRDPQDMPGDYGVGYFGRRDKARHERMPFEANIGAIVQSYLEHFEEQCEIEIPKRKKIMMINWRDIDPDFEVIGDGTYSIVHKVKLLDYQGDFALKFLDPSMLNDNSGEERYKRAAMDVALEGKILERLDHPNIISLRGLCKGQVEANINNESFPYFILLDYLPQTLDNVLQRKRKSASEKLIRTQRKVFDRLELIAVGIASAMEYLHERGLLFRDLKPSNVGFDENGIVKLFDLGNCRDLAFAAKTGEVLGFAGTPRYMATEIGAGKEYGLPSDVYSFGVLLWEIITLRVPFDSIETMEDFKCRVVENHERPNLTNVKSERLRSLIEQCWDPEPRKRPTFTQVREQLEDILREHQEKSSSGPFATLGNRSRSSSFLSRST